MNQIQIEIAKKKALLGQPIDIEIAAKIIAQDRERVDELEQELEEFQSDLNWRQEALELIQEMDTLVGVDMDNQDCRSFKNLVRKAKKLLL